VTPADISRGWCGTPYIRQASLKGVGADCVGLVRGVWREAVGEEPWARRAYDPATLRDIEALERLLAWHFHLAEEAFRPSQLLVFEGAATRHLGIATSHDRFVHAHWRTGTVEAVLTPWWRTRIISRHLFPNGAV
jgi:NlpC/P60 family putative phage cell wall peptidase